MENSAQHLRIRWHAVGHVVKGASPAWLCIGGFGFAALLAFWFAHTPSAAVRYFGTVLQLIGLGVVAKGLRDMRLLFNQPSLLSKVRAWFRQLAVAFGRPQSVNVTASAAGAASASGELSVQLGVPSGAPLEDRVRVLEQNFSFLRDEVRLNKQTLRNEVGAVRNEIERETQGRRADSQRLTRRLEEVAIGGLHLEIVGLLWLVVGILATSIPDELVSLFGRKWAWCPRFASVFWTLTWAG